MSNVSEEINLELEWQKQWSKVCESFGAATKGKKRLDSKEYIATPQDVSQRLRDKGSDAGDKWDKLGEVALKVGKTIVQFSGAIVQVASMVFGPSQMAMNALSFFVEAACAYHNMFESLKTLFQKLADALDRFDAYKRNQQVLSFSVKKRANEILLKLVEISELGYRLLNGSVMNKFKVGVQSVLFKSDQGIGDELAALERLAQIELVQNGIENLVQSGALLVKTAEIREAQKRTEMIVENDKQLSWLKEKLGDENQQEIWRRHMMTAQSVPSSGAWLQEIELFQVWCDLTQLDRSILLLDGVMGSGKTILVSTIIHYIQESMSRRSGASKIAFPAYYYFNRGQTIDAALRAMAMRLVALDELYRKELHARLYRQFESGDLPTNINELFSLLFDGKSSGTIILLFDDIHTAANASSITELSQAITRDQSKYKHIKILVSGRLGVTSLLSNLTLSKNCIDVGSQNKDIKTFIQIQVDELPFLKASTPSVLELKQHVCETLGKCKSFSDILVLLSEIGVKTRAMDIKDVLSKAELGADAAIDRLLTRANELRGDDINDLNVLLRWTSCSEQLTNLHFMSLDDLSLVLNLYNPEPSLKPLKERIEDEFRGFFKINSDSSISFISTAIRDHFTKKTDQAINSDEQADMLRTEGEARILKFQLKNMCDAATYKKFGFDSILTTKSWSTPKLHIDTTQMFAQVVFDCLRLADTTSLLSSVNPHSIHIVLATCWVIYLAEADVSLVGDKLKSELGALLVSMLSQETEIQRWQALSYPGFVLFCDEDIHDVLLGWVKDSVVQKALSEESKTWALGVLSSEVPKKALWFNVAKFKAKQWLIFEADTISTTSTSEVMCAAKPMLMKPELRQDSFLFIRGYLKNLDNPKYSYGSYITLEMPREDIDAAAQWAKTSLGLKEWSCMALCRLADTYRLHGWLGRAAKLYESAVKKDPESVETMVSCAEALFKLDQKSRAISFLQSAIDKLEKQTPVDTEKVAAHICTLANWYSSLERFEEAQAIIEQKYYDVAYQEELFPSFFDVCARQGKVQQSRVLFDNIFKKTIDPEHEDESRCKLWTLLLKNNDNEPMKKILLTAGEIGYSEKINKELQLVLKSFDAVMVNHQGSKEIVYYHMVVSRIELCLNLLAWSQRYPPSEVELLTHVKLCEPSLTIDILHFPGMFQKHITSIQETLILRLCFHYLNCAMLESASSDQEKIWIDKVKDLCSQMSYPQGIYLAKAIPGSYFALRGDSEAAMAMLGPLVEIGLNLLSDDDPANDQIGYLMLAAALLKAGDEVNANLAFSLANSITSSNITTASSASAISSGLKPVSNESLSVADAENPVGEPQLDSEPEADTNYMASNEQRVGGDTCDGKCGKEWTYLGDFYLCRLCYDTTLCKECLEKMKAGKIFPEACNFKHDFFYIPPWNPEKAADLASGKVEVDEKYVTIDEWKDGLRKTWNPTKEEDQDG